MFELTPVDNSAALSGYVTYDLRVTTEEDWTSAAMLLQLDAGHIYQHASGGDSDLQFSFITTPDPALAFDTHVKGNIAGGAGDLDGTGFAFTTERLDVSWFNMNWSDIGTTTIGRLTLSDDAAGTMALFTGGQRFDVALEAGVAPVVAVVVEEEPEPEPTDYGTPSDYVSGITYPSSAYGDNPGFFYPGSWDLPTLIDRPELPLVSRHEYTYITPTIDDTRYSNPAFVPGYHEGRDGVFWTKRNLFFTDPIVSVESSPLLTLPEPTSVALFGLCLGALVPRRRV